MILLSFCDVFFYLLQAEACLEVAIGPERTGVRSDVGRMTNRIKFLSVPSIDCFEIFYFVHH